jgi:hypothetical protein
VEGAAMSHNFTQKIMAMRQKEAIDSMNFKDRTKFEH